jgi:hypothetical protein
VFKDRKESGELGGRGFAPEGVPGDAKYCVFKGARGSEELSVAS